MDFAKKYDKLISLFVVLLTVVFVFILTRQFFLDFAADHPLFGGFIKFFFLASMGDFIGARLKSDQWKIPKAIILKAIVWGLIGIVIVMMFTIFNTGVATLQSKSILPWEGSALALAFFTSLFMNTIFAPTMMSFHRITDTYLDGALSFSEAVKEIDWSQFYKVVIKKTIPFFWIPAHTITFLLPAEYRIIFAAVLGIFLGLLLSFFKR